MREEVTVLLVDDDETFLQMAADMLTTNSDGIEVLTEGTPEGAVDRTIRDGEAIDCVVCDYRMPEMDGLTVFQHLREAGDDVPFFLFTSKGDEEVASAALELGVTDYVRKFNDPEQYIVLANRIQNAVSTHRAEADAVDHETVVDQIVKDSPDGVLIHDGEEVVHVNDSFAEMTGAGRRHQIIGLPPERVLEFEEYEEVYWECGEEPPYEWHPAVLSKLGGDEVLVKAAPSCVPFENTEAVRIAVREC